MHLLKQLNESFLYLSSSISRRHKQIISKLEEITNENSNSRQILIAAMNKTYDGIDEIGVVNNKSNQRLYQNLTKQLKQMEIKMADTVENLNETISQLLADALLEFEPSSKKGTGFK